MTKLLLPSQMPVCRAVGCGVDVDRVTDLMCDGHSQMLRASTRRSLKAVAHEATAANGQPTERYLAAARLAIDEIAHLEERYARTQKGLF